MQEWLHRIVFHSVGLECSFPSLHKISNQDYKASKFLLSVVNILWLFIILLIFHVNLGVLFLFPHKTPVSNVEIILKILIALESNKPSVLSLMIYVCVTYFYLFVSAINASGTVFQWYICNSFILGSIKKALNFLWFFSNWNFSLICKLFIAAL